jgi:pantoate--beta-alanine ligase
MRIVGTFAEGRQGRHGTTGLVPTMGFLHEGHVSLLEAARAACDHVVMSLFVNPLQFDDTRDLSRYPRDLERDAGIAEGVGVDVVIAPEVEEMYKKWPPDTVVRVPPLSGVLEGEFRPGHFDGVATVVTKLFAGAQPDVAFFGRKDGQQLAVVKAMARDLSLPVDVRGMPTVRESDGLALSSRNVFLTPDDRAAALSISRGLMAAADAIDVGERDAARLIKIVRREIAAKPQVTLEYVALAAQDDLELLHVLERPSFLSLAARVGSVRLIDNIHVDLADGAHVADRGQRLDGVSMLYRAEENAP